VTAARFVRPGRESGFTLVESLVAILILMILLLAVAPLFLESVKANASGFDYTAGESMARDRFEGLMSEPLNGTDITVPGTNQTWDYGPEYLDAQGGTPVTVADSSHPYQRSWHVALYNITLGPPNTFTAATGGAPSDVKQITVTVQIAPNVRANVPGLRKVVMTALRYNTDPANVLN